ncbi:MAG TPA: hypothetical protein VFM18_06010 [Methanosarcina sp.]|nr:hypothetical protein [Methanosarcina sp.]
MPLEVVPYLINLLLGVIMFFMKLAHDNLKEELKEHKADIEKIKDSYIKKEDFREFKDELFVRLDEIKLDVRRDIERLSK